MIPTFLTVAVLLYLIGRYSLFLPSPDGIRVLMYHDLAADREDFLTVRIEEFRKQLEWLRKRGYQAVTMREAVAHLEGKLDRKQLPEKPVLMTFDDGYVSNLRFALPILREMSWKATLFVTTSYIQDRDEGRDLRYLSSVELREWVEAGMEVALHSHAHPNYRTIDASAVISDLATAESFLRNWSIPCEAVLAYPFGARPKERLALQDLKTSLTRHGIRGAFRIGNRVQPFYHPGLDLFELKRIDVRGDESFFEFKQKVRKGRTRIL